MQFHVWNRSDVAHALNIDWYSTFCMMYLFEIYVKSNGIGMEMTSVICIAVHSYCDEIIYFCLCTQNKIFTFYLFKRFQRIRCQQRNPPIIIVNERIMLYFQKFIFFFQNWNMYIRIKTEIGNSYSTSFNFPDNETRFASVSWNWKLIWNYILKWDRMKVKWKQFSGNALLLMNNWIW